MVPERGCGQIGNETGRANVSPPRFNRRRVFYTIIKAVPFTPGRERHGDNVITWREVLDARYRRNHRKTIEAAEKRRLDFESDIATIETILAELAYPSKVRLLTVVLYNIFHAKNGGDTFAMHQTAKNFARGLYHEITGR